MEKEEILLKLVEFVRIVDRAVSDWGESFHDGSSVVQFHADQSIRLSDLLDEFDMLPEPDNGYINCGAAKVAHALGL